MALEGANEILSVFSDVIQHAWREAPEGYCDTDFSAPSKTGKVHYKCMVSLLAFLGIHLTYGQTATNVSGARSNVVVVLSVRDARALELNASIFRRMRLCIEGPSENQFLSFMGSRANGVKANSKN
jgi:hypothetical protein